MKKCLVLLTLSILLSSCGYLGKRNSASVTPERIAPVVTDAEQQQQVASNEPDAVSSGAGETESIQEESGSYQQMAAKAANAHDSVYLFDFDSSGISEEYKNDLSEHIRYLTENPNAKILLSGHTDEVGSREYNVALGERRAKSVLNYLKFAGVKPSQVRFLSYGQERPRALGHNPEAYRLNRRVELSYEVS